MADLRDRYLVPLAFHFRVRPWEIDLLTIREFYALCEACDVLNDPKGAS